MQLKLYLIEILHQTTTRTLFERAGFCCILLKFYIKPQLFGFPPQRPYRCILLKFYIKPQRRARRCRASHVVSYWNSTSNHNVMLYNCARILVVSYWNSTSNHNFDDGTSVSVTLYLIEILHQTTTCILVEFPDNSLYLIEILHQTTTEGMAVRIGEELYLIEILHQTTTNLIHR